MTSIGQFVSALVPVNSFSRVTTDVTRVLLDPDVGARWGRPAQLDFQLPEGLNGEQQEPPQAFVRDKGDMRIIRRGHGVPVQEAPPQKPFWLTQYFDCGFHDEYSEETKSLGNNVTEIIPKIIHWRVYFKQDFLPEVTDISQWSLFDFLEDSHVRNDFWVLVDASYGWVEQLPPRFLSEGTGPTRTWEYDMSGASPV